MKKSSFRKTHCIHKHIDLDGKSDSSVNNRTAAKTTIIKKYLVTEQLQQQQQ